MHGKSQSNTGKMKSGEESERLKIGNIVKQGIENDNMGTGKA